MMPLDPNIMPPFSIANSLKVTTIAPYKDTSTFCLCSVIADIATMQSEFFLLDRVVYSICPHTDTDFMSNLHDKIPSL